MRKFKLKNGLTVIHEPRKSDAVAIEISIGTGSNNESKSIAGISHFLEHMIFEGSKTRTAKQISETIENVGGDMNAATSNERTFFYMKLPKNKAMLGFEIISDMVKNPAFHHKIFDKEKRVILEEIKMTTDQPLHYQWILFESSLFKRHPTKNPVYGTMASVKGITRAKMQTYHKRWYVPNNMILSVVGDVKDLNSISKRFFGDMKQNKITAVKRPKEPKDKKPTIKRQKRDINQAYTLLGHKTVHRTHKDSPVLDVISAVFSKGLSGRINEEIRVKRGLAYSVGTYHESKKDYGFFVFYLNCDKKNLALSKRIILDEIKKLDNLGNKELAAAKESIIGNKLISKEDSQKMADSLAAWEFIKDAKLADKYLKDIRKVKKADIIRARNKYLDKNHTMIVISK
ncbi:M16 family metallopeptidase [Nanoarchaeota archaeon]